MPPLSHPGNPTPFPYWVNRLKLATSRPDRRVIRVFLLWEQSPNRDGLRCGSGFRIAMGFAVGAISKSRGTMQRRLA